MTDVSSEDWKQRCFRVVCYDWEWAEVDVHPSLFSNRADLFKFFCEWEAARDAWYQGKDSNEFSSLGRVACIGIEVLYE